MFADFALIKDGLTLLLGLWAVVVSTILAVWKLREYRRQIHLFCYVEAQIPRGTTNTASAAVAVVAIRACNVGHRTVEITKIGFLEGQKDVLSEIGNPVLESLEADKSVTKNFVIDEVFQHLDTLTAIYAENSLGHMYKVPLSTIDKDKIKDAHALLKVGKLLSVLEPLVEGAPERNRLLAEARATLDEEARKWQEVQSELERQKQQYEEFKRYEQETGKRHPDYEHLVAEARERAMRVVPGEETRKAQQGLEETKRRIEEDRKRIEEYDKAMEYLEKKIRDAASEVTP